MTTSPSPGQSEAVDWYVVSEAVNDAICNAEGSPTPKALERAFAKHDLIISHKDDGRQVVWLIERSDLGPRTKYFQACPGDNAWWLEDVHEATKFASKEAAIATGWASADGISVREHVFGLDLPQAALSASAAPGVGDRMSVCGTCFWNGKTVELKSADCCPECGSWYAHMIDRPIPATQPAQGMVCVPVDERLDGNRPLPFTRDELGRMVREAWVRWALTLPDPKPSWLAPYHMLDEVDKEADRQIGEAVARWTLIGEAARTIGDRAVRFSTGSAVVRDALLANDAPDLLSSTKAYISLFDRMAAGDTVGPEKLADARAAIRAALASQAK